MNSQRADGLSIYRVGEALFSSSLSALSCVSWLKLQRFRNDKFNGEVTKLTVSIDVI